MWNTQKQQVLIEDIEIHFVEIPKLVKQWREEKINPWENAFVRWMLLLPAHEDEHLTRTLEEIAMNQDPILQKTMNRWENMSHEIRGMHKNGMPLEDIAKFTGLKVADIQQFLQS